MTTISKYPEVVPGLRRLLRGLPSAVFRAVTGTSLQRSGCALCGIGPHSTHDCPDVTSAVAEEKSAMLFKRWASIVGDELSIFHAQRTPLFTWKERNPDCTTVRIYPSTRPDDSKPLAKISLRSMRAFR